MSLEAAILRLKVEQVREVADVIYDACIAVEAGGTYTEVFRRAKQRKVGSMRKIYERLEKTTPSQMKRITGYMLEGRV